MIHPRLLIVAVLMVSMLLLAGLAACGEAATPVPPTPVPPTATTAPTPTEAPTAMSEEPTEAMMTGDDALMKYAADNAGGPGAVYIGDINQMVGPAPLTATGEPDADLGDLDGNVPLDALTDHLWLYDSDYYKSLIERANLSNPTELTSSGGKY